MIKVIFFKEHRKEDLCTVKKYMKLRVTKEFNRVYNRRRSSADLRLVIYVAKNQLGFSRLGISVSKKVGKSVARNRIKRLIREIFRINYSKCKPGWDIVVIARKPAVKATFEEIKISFMRVGRKLDIFERL